MRHLSHPLLNIPSKVEQTRQLKKVEVTDNCTYQDANGIAVQQHIVNSCLGDYTIRQDIVILRLHHIHIIIIDTTETIHLLLVTIRMKGHVDQNQGVSIPVRMTSIEDITLHKSIPISERCYKCGQLGHLKKDCKNKFRKRTQRNVNQYIINGPCYLYQR